jgi:hypothetical protein
MCSSIPRFQRVVLQSGTASSANLERGAVIRLLEFCGIEETDPERLEKLRTVPVEKLVAGV